MMRRGSLIASSVLTLIGCGRTDLLWWADEQAGDTTVGDGDGDSDPTGDGDGDGDPTGDGDGEPTGDGDGEPTGDGDGEPSTDDDPCEAIVVGLTAQPSTVIILVDRGSHMSMNFSGLSRLESIGVALFDPMQGVAWTWESERRLGLVGFSSFNGNWGGQCPVLATVAPALFSAVSMEAGFSMWQVQDENPVADAIAATFPLFGDEPGHLILLTGRNPDTCAQPNPQNGAGAAVAAAQAAFEGGVETRLVAVGPLDNSYAQSLANAGAGLDTQGMENASWSAPANLDGLRIVLDHLLEQSGTCTLATDIEIDVGSCEVELDGQAVSFGGPDGWTLSGPQMLALGGAACDAYLAGAAPSMTCSCF